MAQAVRDTDRRIFQQLFGNAKQAAFAFSAQTLEVLDANDAAVGLFGSQRRQLIGSNLAALSPPDRAVQNRRKLVSAPTDDLRPFALDVRKSNGKTLRLRGIAAPIAYAGKRAVLVIVGDPPRTLGGTKRRAASAPDQPTTMAREVRRQSALTEFARSALRGSTHSLLLKAATKLLRDTLDIDYCFAFELH